MTLILAAVAWLLTYLLHSTVLLAGALALASIGIVRSHAARDTLWKVALIGGLLTATAQVALQVRPYAGHVALSSHPESAFVDVSGVREVRATPLPAPLTEAGAQFAADIAAAPAGTGPVREVRSLVRDLHISWPAILLNFWFIGALGFGARLLWTRIALKHALRHRRDLEAHALNEMLEELAITAEIRVPRLTVSDRISGPIAFGHEICLPERVLTHLSQAEQRAVLAHELGHVVRRDPAWLMAALAIESLLYLQPLNRFVRRRLRAASEYLCDDWAAERTGGMILAQCLAEVAGWVKAQPAPAVAPGMAGHCSHLVSRVERLLEGSVPARPTRWIVRAGAGALALGLVAWSVPGVAAEDLNDAAAWADAEDPDDGTSVEQWAKSAVDWKTEGDDGGEGWGVVRDEGRLIVFSPGYTARLSGHGRLGFRQWGRAIAIPEGYEIRINGRRGEEGFILCSDARVRLVEVDGDGAWDVRPVRQGGAVAGAPDHPHDAAIFNVHRAADEAGRAALSIVQNGNLDYQLRRAEATIEREASRDQAYGGEADAAIDTLLQLWVRDPEAVRRAARRIARTYDRDLRPQFESLGIEVGRELAPQLQRLTDRVGRDLAPEFARLGAELGLSIVSALGESPESGAGSSDFRDKRKPKEH